MTLDYTNQGRRPTVAQILSDWKKAGKPNQFSVEYGETFACFNRLYPFGQRWQANGNGCRGVERDKVLDKLNAMEAEGAP